jgi:hypothetical protein
MRKIVPAVLLMLLLLPQQAVAAPVSSSQLLENPDCYDQKLVEFEGEVVGDVMVRGNNAWVPVSDGKNTLSVWMPAAFAKEIKYIGSYQIRGDRVWVKGIFYKSCPQHGGSLDIHAQSFRVLERGYEVTIPLDMSRLITVVALGILTLAVIVLNRYLGRGYFF